MILRSKVSGLLGLFLSVLLTACGGGGGSSQGPTGPSPASLSYSGKTSPATITASNAAPLVANMLGSGETAPRVSIQSVSPTPAQIQESGATYGVTSLVKQIGKQLPGAIKLADSNRRNYRPASISINEQQPCDSGKLGLSGTLNDDGTGTLNVSFSACILDGDTYDGQGRMTIVALDPGLELITDASFNFEVLTVRGPSDYATISGSMRMVTELSSNSEILTLNLVIRDDNTKHLMKAENLVLVTTYDNVFAPTRYQETINGRFYDAIEGYIDITTVQAFSYSNTSLDFPDLGAHFIIEGDNGATIEVTSVNGNSLQMGVDVDGDGTPEYDNGMPWSVLRGDTVTVPSAPFAEAGTDQTIKTSTTLGLSSAGSFDNDGDLLTYQWSIASGPANHTARLTGSTSPSPQFNSDTPGTYRIDVTVSDGVNSSVDSITLVLLATTDQAFTTRLTYKVIDAEYSRQLERIVTVSADPDLLHILNPDTGESISIPLPQPPSSVSVAPDGLHAAVGHDGLVSHIDLTQAIGTATYVVSTDVLDTVLAGNGYVYAFPTQGQWTSIRSIELASGNETLHTGNSIYSGTLARLHPDGTSIYGADNGLSPSDIEKYAITGGTADYLYDSPYHGDYPMCGELWFSETGDRIFTRCGRVFQSSDTQSQDMLYRGALSSIQWITGFDHSSGAGQLAVIPGFFSGMQSSEDTILKIFEDQFLNEIQSLYLPLFTSGGQDYPDHGRFAFFSSDGSVLYVIAQADTAAGVEADYHLLRYSVNPWALVTGPTTLNTAPVAKAGDDQSMAVDNPVSLDGNASFDVDGDSLSLAWNIDTLPTGSGAGLTDNGDGTARLTPDVAGTYRLTLTASDGQSSTTDTVSVTVHAGIDVLNYKVIDAEYSAALERLVMVSGNPNTLHIYDPVLKQDTAVALPLAPSSVSVSPDGLYAVVGHNAWLSHIDLTLGTVLATHPVAADVGDVVYAGNGFAHAIPRVDQWVNVHSIDLSTGAETLETNRLVWAGSRGRLHPDGTTFYLSSFFNVAKFSVTAGPADYLYDDTFLEFSGGCSDIWFSEDAAFYFTGCGFIQTTSAVQSEDMMYRGSLELGSYANSISHSMETGDIIALATDFDTELRLYEDTYLDSRGSIALPAFPAPGGNDASHGRFVFHSSDGSRFFVIVQADASAGVTNDYAVVSYVHN